MIYRVTKILAALGLLWTVTGCASIGMRTGDQQGLGMLYSGTAADAVSIGVCAQEAARPKGDPGAGALVMLSLIDLPLSVVVDTLCIPYDLMNLGRKSETIWYAGSMYRVTKTDRKGQLHGKCSFQFHVQGSKYGEGTVWGYTQYKHGLAQGTAEVWGDPLGRTGIEGEYVDGKPWRGSLLLHASDTNSFDVGPIITFDQGVQVSVSNLVLRLQLNKSPNK